MEITNSGIIELDDKVSLYDIIESGQTFLWNRECGKMYSDNYDDVAYTTAYRSADNDKNIFIKVCQDDYGQIKWYSNLDAKNIIKERLGLNHNIDIINKDLNKQKDIKQFIDKAIDKYNNTRLVNEPIFPTLISFICSTQMRVERIHNMVNNIRQMCGDKININDNIYYTFPTADQMSDYTEKDFKQLKLGYRSEYVKDTVETLSKSSKLSDLPENTDKAREELKELMGVGTKVADCTLLYGTDRLNIVPVDTWIDKFAKNYYESIYDEKRSKTARNLEKIFGTYSGYAQLYLFRYMRDKN
jgi:N-glycosylase/DNA lyase